jgi:hypothetical protein
MARFLRVNKRGKDQAAGRVGSRTALLRPDRSCHMNGHACICQPRLEYKARVPRVEVSNWGRSGFPEMGFCNFFSIESVISGVPFVDSNSDRWWFHCTTRETRAIDPQNSSEDSFNREPGPRHLNSKLMHPRHDRRAFHPQTHSSSVGPCHHPIRLFQRPQYLHSFRSL